MEFWEKFGFRILTDIISLISFCKKKFLNFMEFFDKISNSYNETPQKFQELFGQVLIYAIEKQWNFVFQILNNVVSLF